MGLTDVNLVGLSPFALVDSPPVDLVDFSFVFPIDWAAVGLNWSGRYECAYCGFCRDPKSNLNLIIRIDLIF